MGCPHPPLRTQFSPLPRFSVLGPDTVRSAGTAVQDTATERTGSPRLFLVDRSPPEAGTDRPRRPHSRDPRGPTHLPGIQWGLPPRMRKTPPTETPIGDQPARAKPERRANWPPCLWQGNQITRDPPPADRYRRLLFETQVLFTTIYPVTGRGTHPNDARDLAPEWGPAEGCHGARRALPEPTGLGASALRGPLPSRRAHRGREGCSYSHRFPPPQLGPPPMGLRVSRVRTPEGGRPKSAPLCVPHPAELRPL